MKLKKTDDNAKPWKRILAYFIDLMIINLIIVFPFKRILNKENLFAEELMSQIILSIICITILTILYWAVFEYFLRQTIGKFLLNIYVKSKDGELKFWQCAVRNLSKVSSFILLIDCWQVIFNRSYQRYLEIISKTEVVNDGV